MAGMVLARLTANEQVVAGTGDGAGNGCQHPAHIADLLHLHAQPGLSPFYALDHLAQLLAERKRPPYIFPPVPFLGHAIAFGKNPTESLKNRYGKSEPAFRFTDTMFTCLLSSDAPHCFLIVKLKVRMQKISTVISWYLCLRRKLHIMYLIQSS